MAKDPAKMSLKELQELELKVKRAKLTAKRAQPLRAAAKA